MSINADMEQNGKKSTMDYIIATKQRAVNTTHTKVDEKGNKNLYGNNKKEIDHNTIITNIKINNPRMKGQSEIAYLPKFANMMLIVMVIVIIEILYIILIFDCFKNQ